MISRALLEEIPGEAYWEGGGEVAGNKRRNSSSSSNYSSSNTSGSRWGKERKLFSFSGKWKCSMSLELYR